MTPIRKLAVAVLMYSSPVQGVARAQSLIDEQVGLTEAVRRAALEAGQQVCGASALWLHGLCEEPDYHWIRVPEHAGHQPREGVKLRYGPGSGETVWLQGLPTADIPQGLFDAAGSHPGPARRRHRDLVRWISRGDGLRKVTLDGLDERLIAAARFVGKPAVRDAVADLRGSLSHSTTEAKARTLASAVMARHGLQLESRPHPVTVNGEIIGEADLAELTLCLDIEIDGPHHELSPQREEDQKRDRRLRRIGWTVERFPVALVDESPNTFAAQVDDLVRSLLARRPPQVAGG